MDLSSVIADFASSYTVTRTTDNTIDSSGYAVEGTTSTLTISAVVQPLSGRELRRLDDGQRTTERLEVHTTTQLKVQGEPDKISIDGKSWQVESLENWSALGNFWRAVVRKIGD